MPREKIVQTAVVSRVWTEYLNSELDKESQLSAQEVLNEIRSSDGDPQFKSAKFQEFLHRCGDHQHLITLSQILSRKT